VCALVVLYILLAEVRNITAGRGIMCALIVLYVTVFEVRNLIVEKSVSRMGIIDELYV
jgi:hypothetical protein